MRKLRKVILLVSSAREYDRGILRGIADYAKIYGPWMFYEEPPAYLNPPMRKTRLERMRAWRADAIIATQHHWAELRALRLPAVILSGEMRLPARCCQLRTDNRAVGVLAADYLRKLGLTNLAFCGFRNMLYSDERGVAFRERAAASGCRVHIYQPSPSRPGNAWYLEARHLGEWLSALPKPVGLLACNDDRARMVADICHMRDIAIPDEIALLGVDNDEQVCCRATPPLSSISLATERAGYETAALLNRMLSGNLAEGRAVVTQPITVVSRQSTDLIACADPNLVKAIRFIRQNANVLIQVEDVAKAAGLSRRLLQDRFLCALGCTVLDAIHNARLNLIKHLLVETNLSVTAIAEAVGYESAKHLARFFVRRNGQTPSAYRRQHSCP